MLAKGDRGFGFSIAGGSDADTSLDGIFVTKIIPGGSAAADGRLAVGHRLVSVNGTSCEELDHPAAVNLLRSSGERVTLQVVKSLQDTVSQHGREVRLHLPPTWSAPGRDGVSWRLSAGAQLLIMTP